MIKKLRLLWQLYDLMFESINANLKTTGSSKI